MTSHSARFVSAFGIKGKALSGYVGEHIPVLLTRKKLRHDLIMPTIFFSAGTDDPTNHVHPLDYSNKISACIARYEGGKTWEETGVIESSLEYIEESGNPLDGCSTLGDLVLRYENLDRLFDFLAGGGPLYSVAGNDAIVHIGQDGQVYFGGGAHHRTAMAWILDIHIPVRPFLIHEKGQFKLKDLLHDNSPLPENLR